MAICTMVIVAERSGLAEHWAFSAGRASKVCLWSRCGLETQRDQASSCLEQLELLSTVTEKLVL